MTSLLYSVLSSIYIYISPHSGSPSSWLLDSYLLPYHTMDELKPYAVIVAAISLASVLLIRTLFSNVKVRSKGLRLPPGPQALPIVGHLHLIRAPIHQSFHKLSTRYGPLIYLRLGSTPCFVASSPELARELIKTNDVVLCNRPENSAVKQFAYDAEGFVFAPYGPYYGFMKKLCISELLGGRTVDQLAPVRRTELMALLQTLLVKSRSGDPVDLSWELIKMTNSGIIKMVASTTPSDTVEARKLVKQVAELLGAFNLADYIWLCRNLDLQGIGKRIKDVHRRFDALTERIIVGKEEARRRNKKMGVKDVLDLLLDASEDENAKMKPTRDNIKGFVLDVFSAGSDPIAATVDWALAELINHPNILQKAREEIEQVVGRTRLVEESDILNLPFLQAIVKETLRLHPAVPVFARKSTGDFTVNGYNIPVNSHVMINLWSIGRDPNYWTDPLEFQPERFITYEDGGGMTLNMAVDLKGKHFQLLPFGGGRRGCPGILLALQVMPVALASLIHCFDWKVNQGCQGRKMIVDMEDGVGLVSARAHPLLCVPTARLDPFPPLQCFEKCD